MRAPPVLLLSCLWLSCDAGAPTSLAGPQAQLASLSLKGLPLSPAFDPSVHDYAVRCLAGTSFTTVQATGQDGAPVRLVAPSEVALGGQVMLAEGELVVLEAGAGASASRTYVRCLPHDLPAFTVRTHPENGAPGPGWYLLGNTVVGAGSGSYALVLDQRGTPVWYRRMGGAMDVDALGPNLLGLTPYLAARADLSGNFTELHLDTGVGERIDPLPGLPLDPHELQHLPDGSRLELAMPLVPDVDLSGLFSYDGGTTLMDCVVQVRDPGGALTWSWRASEHVDPVRETTVDAPVSVNGAPVADAFHCNSATDDGRGGFIVSARHLDAVFRVDRASGRITWKLGGAPTSRDGAQLLRFVGDPNGGFYRQHDARLTADGTLSLFDDESQLDRPARAVEYALDLEAGTATLVYAHAGIEPSAAMGSYRRLADGTRVVGWGWQAGPLALTELSPDGGPVLDLAFTEGSHAYRALKVPAAMLSVDLLRQF